ncbi:class I SAM-dependent methyltransferase [Neisseria leonii]|uniref:class I SAM-dependent methyltransferase n=1 Tax=Neisseria leonii TaxID=2995413 RepID=UPI00237BFCCB|nr:SAM-dependent methyltransferase [Neisseria sp. 3986]MDD9326563.1 SAM-dependent methyltransferase [Neisseria sp. 3986]
MPPDLPQPETDALHASLMLQETVKQEIRRQGGWIPFSRFMQLALYAPQYGYYTGGAHKIGAAGDFITAPTLSPLFGQTLARQLAELLPQTAGTVYEFGAGTGALAATLLQHLPPHSLREYCIIELSPDLAARQLDHIRRHAPEAAAKVHRLNTLPDTFDGIIIGNEVLDAMPAERIARISDGLMQVGTGIENDTLCLQNRPLDNPGLIRAAETYLPHLTPYTSELHPAQHAFIRTLADKLTRGAMIWIDYGFDAAQYYHPQRSDGTLIGHYRHHTVHDPLFLPGLTDLTAHVNFTDIADAGCSAGLDLIGYLPQSRFLLNLGITDLLAQTAPPDSAAYLHAAAALNQLTAQHEMGELFKVIAFGRHIGIDWTGFRHGDICHKL